MHHGGGVGGEKRFFKIASQGLRQPPPNFAGAWGVPEGSFTRSYMPPNPLDPSLGCLYGSKIECPNQLGRRKTMKNRCFSGFSRDCAHGSGPNVRWSYGNTRWNILLTRVESTSDTHYITIHRSTINITSQVTGASLHEERRLSA